MRPTMLCVLVLSAIVPCLAPGAARAQSEEPAATTESTTVSAPDTAPDAAEDAALEPAPIAEVRAGPEPARLARPTTPSPMDALEEPLPSPPDPTVDRVVELFWAASGILAFGLSPALSTRVDFAFAVDRQWLVGPQLSVVYAETTYMGFPDSVNLSTTVIPGLFLQHYFIPPTTGGVMPTLRVGLGLSYTENSNTSGGVRTANVSLGANAAVSGGVTWLPEPWLGVRIIGGATTSVTVVVEGMPEQVNASLGVFAEAGVVVRI